MAASVAQLIVLVVAATAASGAAADPTASISQGQLRGKLMTSRAGRSFAAFLGIPYARPPVGELRFRAPLPAKAWSGVLNATEEPPLCIQRNDLLPNPIIAGQEDCLYLNVYTHQVDGNTSQGLLPVMVFIHGGAWFSGGSPSYLFSPVNLLDKDIVLVAINYRLGVLGFLSTGDAAAPGNSALKDQAAALRWVRDNVRAFGGDPAAVTVFGQSAGAGSVHLHMLSPLSAGLFQRAISESGVGIAAWAFPTADPLSLARSHGQLVGCHNDSTQALVQCLRGVQANTLVETTAKLKIWSVDPLTLYRPVVEPSDSDEEVFLPASPLDILREAVSSPGNSHFVSVPWIAGVIRDEGIIRAVPIISDTTLLEDLNSRLDELMPVLLELNSSVVPGGQSADQLWTRVKEYFFPQTPDGGPVVIGEHNAKAFIQVYGDRAFYHALHLATQYHSKAGHKDVFVYSFEYRGTYSYTGVFANTTTDYGVCHCDELLYLLPTPVFFPPLPESSPDWQAADALVQLWTTFATHGTPTLPPGGDSVKSGDGSCASSLQDLEWPSIGSAGDSTGTAVPYLQITASSNSSSGVLSFCLMDDLLKERMQFWDSLPLMENNL